MADLGELTARLSLDTSALGAGLAVAEGQMAQVGSVGAAEFGRVTTAADAMGRGVVVSAQGFGVLATESRTASSSIGAAAGELTNATGRAGDLGGAVGSSATAMGHLASASGATASELSSTTGSMSGVAGEAGALGSAVDNSAAAMGQLASSTGQTSSELSSTTGTMAGVSSEAAALGSNVGAASNGFIRLNDSVQVASSGVSGVSAQMSQTANVGQTMYVQVSQSGGAFNALGTAGRALKGDMTGAGTEMTHAGSAALAMGQRVEGSGKSYTVLDQLVSRAIASMGQWFARLQGSASPLERAIGGVGTKVIDLAKNMSPGVALASASAVGAIAGLTVAAGAGVKNFVDLGTEIRNFQRFTSASATEASKMVYALDRVGVGADVGSKAFGRLALSIEKQPGKFDELGIAISKNADGTVNLTQTLYNVADAYMATNDPTQKALIAQTAFGASWRTMVPLLSQGSAGLRRMGDEATRFGLVMDQKGVDATKRFKAGTADLKDAIKGLTMAIGSEAVPVIAELAAGLASIIVPATHAVSSVGGLRAVMLGALNTVNPLVGMLAEYGQHVLDSGKKTDVLSEAMATEAARAGLTDQEVSGLSDSTAQAAIEQHNMGLQTDYVSQRLTTLKNSGDLASRAFDAIKASTIGSMTATLDVADAFAKLKDTLSGGTQATLDVADAQVALGRALERQKQVYADAKSSALDKRDADLAVQHAQLALQTAMDSTNKTMDITTTKGRENMRAFADAASAVYAHAQALADAHAPADAIRAAWDLDTTALYNQMIQAGYTQGQVQALFAQYGLVPPTIDTFIQAHNLTETIALMQILSSITGQLTGAQLTMAVDVIGAEDAAAALAYLAALMAYVAPGQVPDERIPPPPAGWGGAPKKAWGGLTTGPSIAGEAGQELVLPLTKPQRMRQLLDQYGGQMANAAGMSGGAGSVAQSSNTTWDVHDNVFPVADPAELQRKLEMQGRISAMSGKR